MIGKWIHLTFREDQDTFLTGEIVGLHGEHYCEVRPVHFGDDPDAIEANAEPPSTELVSLREAESARLFDSEQALRAWWDWLHRPETLSEARRRLRPVS